MLARAASLVVVLFGVSSCVLLTAATGFEAGEHCGFTGSGACATCLRTSCQAKIDACCNDSTCRASDYATKQPLAAIDACGTGPAATCAAKVKSERAETGTAQGEMFSCLETSCREACLAGERTTWTCASPRDSTSTCAACIYTSCTKPLEACCGDTSCASPPDSAGKYPSRSVMGEVDACVAGDAPGCAGMLDESDSGKDGALRTCIANQCTSACLGNLRPHQRCTLRGGGAYCSCQNAETASGDECGTSTVGGTCLATSTGCACGAWSCAFRSSSPNYDCTCEIGASGGGSSECSADRYRDGVCCIKVDYDGSLVCRCTTTSTGASRCSTSEATIASCDLATVKSTYPKLATDRCSQ
jgi:hypothetical protein